MKKKKIKKLKKRDTKKPPLEEEKKKIEELKTRYDLEPQLKDIYVEGVFDKVFLEWFLEDNRIKDVTVYLIETISLSDDILKKFGLNISSNRSKVIALSAQLAETLPPELSLLCVVDRDNEDYISTKHSNSFLAFSDYNSMEVYAFHQKTVRKFLSLVVGGFRLKPDQFIKQIGSVLEEIYLFRLTNQSLMWGMEWLSFRKYIIINSDFSLDSERFLKNYLQKNSRWRDREAFQSKYEELRSNLKGDYRFRLRGHDLIEIINIALIKLKKNRKFDNIDNLSGAFMGCLESGDLSKEKLFQRVLSL